MVHLRSGQSTNMSGDTALQQCHLVTGGGGYVGYRLGLALYKQGHKVVLVDVREPADVLPDNMSFIQVHLPILQA